MDPPPTWGSRRLNKNKDENPSRLQPVSSCPIPGIIPTREFKMINTERSSSDLYLVSFIYAHGIQPSGIEGAGRRKIFYFDDPKFEELTQQYYSRQGTIEPIAFTNAIRNVKALIYNQ